MNLFPKYSPFLLAIIIIGFFAETLKAQPATLTATIGTPANGASHFINLSWATVGGATAYELEVSDNGTSNWTNIYNGAATTYSHNTGNLANTPFYYRVRSVSGSPSSYTNATQFPVHTACDEPALVQISNATPSGLSIVLPAETPVANPATTTYSIFCTTTSQFVQANGTLGASEVFQTRSQWGTVAVTGLASNTNYCFYSKARNADGDTRTVAGNTLLTTETFSTNGNFSTQSGSGPTNRFWSPSSCNSSSGLGGLIYSSNEGCPSGSIGYSGAWNSFWGCFLRTPATNCSGSNSVTLTFDLSHSYTSTTTNNYMRIYYYADGAYTNNTITSLTINGVNALASFGVNGQGIYYTELRTCGKLEATFNISGVSDKSNILFYIEPKSAYNNSQPFFTWIDNVGIAGTANATACLSTTSCTAPGLLSNPTGQSVCVNGNTTFSVTTSGSVAGYQWQVNEGSGFNNINNGGVYSNATTATLNITGATSGLSGYQYRCLVTAACGNNLTSGAATLTVNTAPSATGIVSGDNAVCKNSSKVFTSTTINGATAYVWTLPAGAAITNGSGTNTITVAFDNSAQPGNITVAGSNTCGTGPASAPFAITIYDVPGNPSGISGNLLVCNNSTVVYSISPLANTTSYTWTLPAGATITNGSGTNSITVAFGNNAQPGSISVAGVNDCGTGPSTTSSIVFTDVPASPALVNVSGDFCVGAEVDIEVSSVAGATFYTWSVPSGWQLVTSSTNTATVVIGSTAVNISITANNNCGASLPTQINATGIDLPAAIDTILGADTVCAGAEITYEVQPGVSGSENLIWQVDMDIAGNTDNTITCIAGTTNAAIEVTRENECGTTTSYIKNIFVVWPGDVTFQFNDNPVCLDAAPFELTQGTSVGGVYSGVGINASGFFSATAAGEGIHFITYTVTENNCSFTATDTIVVEVCTGINTHPVASGVKVYPNPFNNHIIAEGDAITRLMLTDISGKVMAAKTFEKQPLNSVELNITNNIAEGIYLLHVVNQTGYTSIVKVLKQ